MAEINNKIFELEKALEDIESRLRWDDASKREWYLSRKAEVVEKLDKSKQEHDGFIYRYSSVIYS